MNNLLYCNKRDFSGKGEFRPNFCEFFPVVSLVPCDLLIIDFVSYISRACGFSFNYIFA